MTTLDRLAGSRRILAAAVVGRAVLWAATAALGVLATAALLDWLVGLPRPWRAALLPLAQATALAAFLAILWRGRAVRRPEQVALWIEEREPALRFALVTRLDPALLDESAALDRHIAPVPFEHAVRAGARAALGLPLAAAALAGLALVALPGSATTRVLSPRAGDALSRPASHPGDALATVVVAVVPPAYSRIAGFTLENPARIAALTGSRLRIEGRVAGTPVMAVRDSLPVPAQVTDDRWWLEVTMPAAPSLIRLRQDTRERLLLLEPRADSAPVVTLTRPLRDTVLRAAAGTVPLAAELRDDIGLRESWWEVVVSSGQGENFSFRTLTLGREPLRDERQAQRSGRLTLDSLGLNPGDLVHLRAVARDGNTVSGPGIAGSDTRTIRIARADEYDSLAVEALPPPDPLAGLLSQRMLILLTEALERKRPRLPREQLVAESRRIASDQGKLRRQVGDLIFSRLEEPAGGGEHSHDDGHDHGALTPDELLKEAEEATNRSGQEVLDFAEGESPVVAINRPLLEAYNAMWEAGRELGTAEPRRALPHMYAALEAIQRARRAERFYLRGRTRDVIVDVGKVRLAGKTEGLGPADRAPRPAEDASRAALGERLDRLAAMLGAGGPAAVAAVDSLLLLRLELLGRSEAAGPLGDAIDALRQGRDATALLVRVRRALAGPATARTGLGPWSPLP